MILTASKANELAKINRGKYEELERGLKNAIEGRVKAGEFNAIMQIGDNETFSYEIKNRLIMQFEKLGYTVQYTTEEDEQETIHLLYISWADEVFE